MERIPTRFEQRDWATIEPGEQKSVRPASVRPAKCSEDSTKTRQQTQHCVFQPKYLLWLHRVGQCPCISSKYCRFPC